MPAERGLGASPWSVARVAVWTVTPLWENLIELPIGEVSGLGARRGGRRVAEARFAW